MENRNILVTCALPYANGPIHMGHMVEHIQADIWVRFQRMRGHTVHFYCADDAHGTPIMLNAKKQGITPEELVNTVRTAHESDFKRFGVFYDHYSSTHADSNRELVYDIYQKLKEKDLIDKRTIKQFFDPKEDMFLPDRFIKGTCPKCGTEDQYGDSCESCGSTYDPLDIREPKSALSGETPVIRESEHHFVKLSQFEKELKTWTRSGRLQDEVANKLDEWFQSGLNDWDISRDKPYFGFEIPDAPGKFFYVWMDAPVGYIATNKEHFDSLGRDYREIWNEDSDAEVFHFIGKDIIYFHALFWPAMLAGANLRTPTAIYAHGFLTVNGTKMSKSRGTFISADTYLNHLRPDYLRYYFAAKLSDGLADIDWNLEDFVSRINSDLVGKVVNIASRCAGFIAKKFDGQLSSTLPDPELYQRFRDAASPIAADLEARRYNAAVRRIMAMADEANRYIDEHKPWQMIKQDGQEQAVQDVCTQGINLFRALITWLKPIIPFTTAPAEAFLNAGELHWDSVEAPLLGHKIASFKPLITRIDPEHVEKMVEESKPKEQPAEVPAKKAATESTDNIDIQAFLDIDLRAARVITAEHVEGADKLLRLTLDVGELGQRQVFAGIKAAYAPETLNGTMVVVVANLKPRKMRFGQSEGMVLAAGPGGEDVHLIRPDKNAAPGMRVK